MLVDAPFADILREWQWSSPSATTALFWLLALVAAGVLALRRCRSRLTFYELAVLVLTFAGAVQAVRGVIWFALAAAAILPVALDGLLTKEDVVAPRVNRIISLAALAGLALAALVFVARPASWFVSDWPEARVAAVREATRDPSVRVWATDGTADWLLWRIPDLRGRLAYDVRFELYDQPALDRIVAYGRRRGDWKASARRLPRRDRDDSGTSSTRRRARCSGRSSRRRRDPRSTLERRGYEFRAGGTLKALLRHSQTRQQPAHRPTRSHQALRAQCPVRTSHRGSSRRRWRRRGTPTAAPWLRSASDRSSRTTSSSRVSVRLRRSLAGCLRERGRSG